MKKSGFTLVEMMVAVSIISIFAAMGVTTYRGLKGNSVAAKKKADIDSIAQAYEATYSYTTRQYRTLLSTDFSSGNIPTSADSTVYNYVTGPNATDNKRDVFKVCTSLDLTVTSCSNDTATCYCQSSSHKTPT
jgi:prepilin-type N-terminal cleavage/methylation domain-containing protein